MTNDSKLPELTSEDRVQLRQLAELVAGTAINDKLFEDILVLSGPVLEKVKTSSTQLGSTSYKGWESFEAFQTLDLILRDLLLAPEDIDSESSEEELKTAAENYGENTENVESSESFADSEIPVIARFELELLRDSLAERLPEAPSVESLEAMFANIAVPSFVLEARVHGWDEAAVVEQSVNFYLSNVEDDVIAEMLKVEEPVSDSEVASSSSSVVDVEDQNDVEAVGGDLSPANEDADTFDEGEWGLAEIDPGDELDEDEAFEEVANEADHDDGPHHHSHQILEDELRGSSDYEGEPVTEQEKLTLALMSEGLLYAEPSNVLLEDFIAECESIIRHSRVIGPHWWLTLEAQSRVADTLSILLSGERWQIASGSSDYNSLGHRDKMQAFAAVYPHEPELSRKERLAKGSLDERLELLRSERNKSDIENLSDSEVTALRDIIEDLFYEKPTRILVEDLASVIPESVIKIGRMYGWRRKAATLVMSSVMELLLGVDCSNEYWSELDKETFSRLQVAIRTYKTDELTEDEFIAHYDQSRWPSIGASVDLSVFTIIDGKLQVLLIERGNHPSKGKWALPGGFIDTNESIDEAAARELLEETSVDISDGGYLEQVKTYGYPGRDRRGYIISTLYTTLIAELPEPKAGDDAVKARFVPVDEALSGSFPLAFDHEVLLRDALERVQSKIEYSPIVFDFLPKSGFTIDQLRAVYETVWGYELSPSDFRRRISQAMGALSPSDKLTDGKVLWARGSATTFFPPLDRREVLRA